QIDFFSRRVPPLTDVQAENRGSREPSRRLYRLLARAIGAPAIEIDQDIAWFGPFARADDAPVLQLIHDARGSRVAEAQSPLHEGNARLLFAPDDFNALLDEVLVFFAA